MRNPKITQAYYFTVTQGTGQACADSLVDAGESCKCYLKHKGHPGMIKTNKYI